MVCEVILWLLAICSLGITIWQHIVARRFPLHKRCAFSENLPDITILKPLKGDDGNLRECLSSWLNQRYNGKVQFLFAVDSQSDSAYATAQGLLKEFNSVDADIIICGENRLATNAKVSKLIQLSQHIKHKIIVVSDADVYIESDFLNSVISFFEKEKLGMASCFYYLSDPKNFPMRLEAVAINSDFWTQVLQSRSLNPIDFALGAVMIMRMEALDKIGGFEAVSDRLADDYWLGNLIAKAGFRVEITRNVVECRHNNSGLKDVWQHQLRWTRTIRVCKPIPFFFSIISNLTLFSFLLVSGTPSNSSLLMLLLSISVRASTAALHYKYLTQKEIKLWNFWMPIVKDIFNFCLWVAAFCGNKVLWRNRIYKVSSDGRMIPMN